MSGRTIFSAHTGRGYTPEQESDVRTLYETLGRAKMPDRRIIAAALTEAFMSGMETQEQIHANAQRSMQSPMATPGP